MQELLDDQQVGQEEKKMPKVIYWLAASYVAFLMAVVVVEFDLFDVVWVDFFAIFCLCITLITSIGALSTQSAQWGRSLRGYGFLMLATEVLFLAGFLGAIFGWYSLGGALFDGLLVSMISAIAAFLVAYYKGRENAAAWWSWLHQGVAWYWLLHLDKLLLIFVEVSFFTTTTLLVVRISLFWLGAWWLLLRQFPKFTTQERQVSTLLYVSFGLILSILEINSSNNTFIELLLIFAIILLLGAIQKSQPNSSNSDST